MLTLNRKIINEEIIVLEDNHPQQEEIKNALEEELNCKVQVVESKDEVVSLAQRKEAFAFILDVHLGKNKEQDGLNALEEIKYIDSNVFVATISAYKKNEKLAKNLHTDIFVQKTTNLKKDIIDKVVPVLKEYRRKCLKAIIKEAQNQLKKLDALDDFNSDIDTDPNITAYKKLLETPEWFDRYKDKYVAFVDGNLVDSDESKQELLKKLHQKYPDKSGFFKQVKKEEEETIIDIPYYDIM